MMPNFKPRLGTKFQAQTAPVNDGQFIVATDSRELFYDNGTLRIPLADIVFLNTEEERASILAPLPKFYFVIATGKLYVWDGTIWTIRLMRTLCRRHEAFRLFCSSGMARSVL